MKIAFAKPGLPKEGALAVPVLEGRKLGPTAAALDRRTKGALMRALKASRFDGKLAETLAVLAPRGLSCSRLVLVGFGKAGALDALAAQRIGGALVAAAGAIGRGGGGAGGRRVCEDRRAGRGVGRQHRAGRQPARLPLRSLSHDREARPAAEPESADAAGRGAGRCAQGVCAAGLDGAIGRGRPRSRERARQCHHAPGLRGGGKDVEQARRQGRSAGRQEAEGARPQSHARRGAGQRA